MATLSRRDQHDAARKATETALLQATITLLGQGSSYSDLSIEQIVRQAGYSRPTFYAYFRDKRDLVLLLGEAFEAEVAAAADPWLESAEGQTRETLIAVWQAFCDHREAVRAIAEAATYDEAVQTFWINFHERFIRTATQRVAEGDPNVTPQRAQARAYALVWMTERTFTAHLEAPDEAVETDALLDELTHFWQQATKTQT